MWDCLAKMFRVNQEQVESAVFSERAARATLTRRGLLVAGACAVPFLASGRLFADAPSQTLLTLADGEIVSNRIFHGPTLIRMAERGTVADCRFFGPVTMEGMGLGNIFSHNYIDTRGFPSASGLTVSSGVVIGNYLSRGAA